MYLLSYKLFSEICGILDLFKFMFWFDRLSLVLLLVQICGTWIQWLVIRQKDQVALTSDEEKKKFYFFQKVIEIENRIRQKR